MSQPKMLKLYVAKEVITWNQIPNAEIFKLGDYVGLSFGFLPVFESLERLKYSLPEAEYFEVLLPIDTLIRS